MGITVFIGGRGEAIAVSHLTRLCQADPDRPDFRPHFLGEKCETFDYLAELMDAGEKTPFLFIQIKSTRKRLTRSQTPPRLRVEVSKRDVRRMVAYPAPAYVVGVQEVEERAFIIAVHGSMSEAIPSITTAHELTCETLRRLWDEVREYWQGRDMTQSVSSLLN